MGGTKIGEIDMKGVLIQSDSSRVEAPGALGNMQTRHALKPVEGATGTGQGDLPFSGNYIHHISTIN